MPVENDPVNAFVSRFLIDGAPSGPLAGKTFVAKDIYDVAGHVTGCGNPDWVRTHMAATAHCPPVTGLLAAGAQLIGKTHTDELAYSLMGANAHFGTPVNSAAPDRVPGGSSSGSASTVAAGLADIGLGSDTGGSVRLPASFCGLWGIRPTHGRIDIGGTMPLAPSYDTVGWFTRDPELLSQTAEVFGRPVTGPTPRLMLPVDIWARASAPTVAALAPALERLQARFGVAAPVRVADDDLSAWREAFRITQAAEVWEVHGAWVTEVAPTFGPGVRDRFEMASRITEQELTQAKAARIRIAGHLHQLLGENGVLVMPTSPDPAPHRDADNATLDDFRTRALEILCPAGHGGLPQVTMPLGIAEGAPVGLSLVGPRDGEGMLLTMARGMAD